MVLGFQEKGSGDMPIPHLYSSQIYYCEPIKLPHTPTQTAITYNLSPYKHVNKHAYLFMMEPEKYRKAILISVSALGYNQLKNVQEDVVLNFNFRNYVFAVLSTGFDESLCYTCLPGVFSTKKDLQIYRMCFEESLPNSQRSLNFNASPQPSKNIPTNDSHSLLSISGGSGLE